MNTRLDALWNSTPRSESAFQREQVAGLPPAARRYLEHAIEQGTPLACAVRLRMHGEIKLKRWRSFAAEQVIRRDGGMIWSATVRLSGVPIRGFDQLIAGAGAMRWKLFGIIPIVAAKGADITRSTVGRVASEFVWLPSALCADGTSWSALNPWQAQAHFTLCKHAADLGLGVADDGRVRTIALQRWGNPEGGEFHNAPFGGIAEQEKTFDGYTIPSRLRVGWYVGSDRFERNGEFFRVIVDEALFR